MHIAKLVKRLAVVQDHIDKVEDRVRYSCILHDSYLGNQGLDGCYIVINLCLQSVQQCLSFTTNL